MLKKALILACLTGLLISSFYPPVYAQNDYEVVFEDEEENDGAETQVYTPPSKRDLISPAEFRSLQKEGSTFLLDVRGKAELKYGVIENTINIPLYVLSAEYKKLPQGQEIVIFCDNGMRALFAYDLLIGKGFTKLRFLNHSIKFSPTGEYEIIIPRPKPN